MMELKTSLVESQKGTVLIISLLLLLVLTLIALSLINTSSFELAISGNERTRAEAFYAAEAGIQRALSQLPSTEPIPLTRIGNNAYYWSGRVGDRERPAQLESLGLAFQYGSDLSQFAYRRIRIHVTGEAQGAVRELEIQVKVSRPISPSTQY